MEVNLSEVFSVKKIQKNRGKQQLLPSHFQAHEVKDWWV
jgi:hypothetical protein